jgi:hypothetical protein
MRTFFVVPTFNGHDARTIKHKACSMRPAHNVNALAE